MKKIIISLFVAMTLLTSCSNGDVKSIYEYNQHRYEPVNNWFMVDETGVEVRFTDDDGKNYNGIINNNSDNFIYTDDKSFLSSMLLHNTEDKLPSIDEKGSIEKILIDFYDDDKKDFVIDETKLDSFINDCKKYDRDNCKIKHSDKWDSLGTINVYYKNCNAYQFYGHLLKVNEKLALYKLLDKSSGEIDEYLLLSMNNLEN